MDQRVFAGTPLTGPVDATPAVTPSLATRVTVRWVALERPADSLLSPIDSKSQLNIAPQSDSPLLTSGRLTRSVRFAQGPAAEFSTALIAGTYGRSHVIAEQSGTVVPGATLQLAATPEKSETLAAVSIAPRAGDNAATRGESATVAVLVGKQAVGAVRDIEVAVVDAVEAADGAGFVVMVPLKIAGSPWRSIAGFGSFSLQTEPGTTAELQAQLTSAAEAARAQQNRSPLGDGPAIRSALAAVTRPESRRPALLLLASMHSARIAEDFVLVAEDARLQKLGDDSRQFAGRDPLLPSTDWQWFLDQAAMKMLLEGAEAGNLPAELQSVLALHAGDAARRPDAIADILMQVNSPDALQQRLIAENLIALEDPSPAARVRAFEWLSSRGKAPAGFDPLADARTRRQAIDKALSPTGGQP